MADILIDRCVSLTRARIGGVCLLLPVAGLLAALGCGQASHVVTGLKPGRWFHSQMEARISIWDAQQTRNSLTSREDLSAQVKADTTLQVPAGSKFIL